MFARWSAFFVWALVAASAVAWGLKLFTRALTAPAQTVVAAPAAAAGGDWTRVFGAAPPPSAAVAEAVPPPAPESARFQLIGVVAPRPAAARSQGVALIAVDGKTPRAYRVGAVIDGDHVLQSVQPRGVAIGPRQGQATVMLELPALPPPATGIPSSVPGSTPPGALPTLPMPAGQPAPAPSLGVPPAQRLRALQVPLTGQPLPQPVAPPVAQPLDPVQTDSGVTSPGQFHPQR
jgi:general secretion pathway protein C